ncbi:MAG: helix-turn-helix domain-containing protein [Chloroflexi bacterium]|nr:helix-turn-helix domain-containing protein [Chloroflexota bacterium]
MSTSEPVEQFRTLLLRFRGRSGLSQRELAERVGVHRRSVQEWEIGITYPTAERLEALIRVLLETHGLDQGREAADARALATAVQREAPHAHAPFDEGWFARLLADPVESARPAVPQHASDERVPSVLDRTVERRQDWGEAPDTTAFVGRSDELALLRGWLRDTECRLVVVLGMGGIGKTTLSAKLAHDLVASFDRVYWRSLRDAPPAGDWLAGVIGFLSEQRLVPPQGDSERLMLLLQLLRDRRCLVVLDNAEALIEPGQQEARYREGMAGYGRLLRVVAEASHQSCFVVTSREAPPEVPILSEAPVRTLQLAGLGAHEVRALLASRQLEGTTEQWAELTARLGGNALALKVVSDTIRELYAGEIGTFLEDAGDSSVFGDIRQLLFEQVERSSPVEQEVLQALAVAREAVPLGTLLADLGPRVGRGTVLGAVEALRRRSLVERADSSGAATFTLQSVVLEYVTDRLVQDVVDEIETGAPLLLVEQALIKAQAKDYVRHSQELLIGAAILQRLKAVHGGSRTEQLLVELIELWRHGSDAAHGYGPGNVVNLLRLLRGDLSGLDLSGITIRDAYLAATDMQSASLADAELLESVLTESFHHPTSVALSAAGGHLAVGTATGELYLWRVVDRTLLLSLQAHTSGVHGLALSSDGRMMASGSEDGTVKVWNTQTGQLAVTIRGHIGSVPDVALSADSQVVVSAGMDSTVRLWSAVSGDPIATFIGHTDMVRGVALSADGAVIGSGADDGTVRLWAAERVQPLVTLNAHTGPVRSVALSADGRLAASAGVDGMVKLWAREQGELLATLERHAGPVYRVALSADGGLVAAANQDGTVTLWDVRDRQVVLSLKASSAGVGTMALSGDGRVIVSCSHDGTLTLWEAPGGQLIATLEGYTAGVRSVALSADRQLVASASNDRTVKLWDGLTGRLTAALGGHASGVWGVALEQVGQLVASSSEDGTVKLWDTQSGRCVRTLSGHASAVWGVALSADGQWLASASEDATIRLWELHTGRLVATLRGHTSAVWSVALSADGRLLVSAGDDGTIRLWATPGAEPLTTLRGHGGPVYGVALSGDDKLLASASFDGTVRVWDLPAGTGVGVLEGHTGLVQAVALSADGRVLASGSFDRTVRLWAAREQTALATLEGHTGPVFGVALSPDGGMVASGSLDGTVRLWDRHSGTCIRALRSDRRYERLNITGLRGVTPAQRADLLALGAVEHEATHAGVTRDVRA